MEPKQERYQPTKARHQLRVSLNRFTDEHALLIDDTEHSEEEDRFILLGLSSSLRMLVVCHCYREGEGLIRIISARKANRKEREFYNRRWSV